jgi:DNA-binding LytR/AlgR family response regulator
VVNPGFIREIDRTESGDHRLALHGGLAVPMSRRYKQAAQAVLKRQPSAPL